MGMEKQGSSEKTRVKTAHLMLWYQPERDMVKLQLDEGFKDAEGQPRDSGVEYLYEQHNSYAEDFVSLTRRKKVT